MLLPQTKRKRLNLKCGFAVLLLVWILHTILFAWHNLSSSSPPPSRVDDDDDDEIIMEDDDDGEKEENNAIPQTNQAETTITVYDFSSSRWTSQMFPSNRFTRAKSWSDSKVEWFMMTHCATYSTSVDDRFMVKTPLCCALPASPTARARIVQQKLMNLPCQVPFDSFSTFIPSSNVLFNADDVEMVLVHSHSNDIKMMSVMNAKQFKLQQPYDSPDVFVELCRDKEKLMLIENKQFALRVFVFPELLPNSKEEHLGYYSIGHVLQSEVDFTAGGGSNNAKMYVTNQPNPHICLKDIPQTLPLGVMTSRMEQILTILLSARQNAAAAAETRVLGEPLCVDFEWRVDSRVMLKRWLPFSECQPDLSVAKRCEGFFQPNEDFIKLVVQGNAAAASSLHALSTKHICPSSSSYETLIAVKTKIEQDIQTRVFAAQKTYYLSSDEQQGIKCTKCEYVNHMFAKRCDLCGARLASSTTGSSSVGGEFTSAMFSGKQNSDHFRQRLMRVFQRSDPSRLASIDVLLERYRGEEEQLVQRVENQYRALDLV